MAERELFFRVSEHDKARELFQRNCGAIEIETFSYCNRRCNYCPNAVIDRITSNNFLDDTLFQKIIIDLKEINFAGFVTLSHYNEPLSDKKIIEHIRFTRAALPNATIQIFTNGDYLRRDYLDALAGAGLSAMYISIHLGDNEDYNDLKIFDRINEMSVRIGIPAKHKDYVVGQSIQAVFNHPTVSITMFEADYKSIGGNRGGLLSHIQTDQRTSPCSYPFHTMTIAHNGYIMPCCQVRADAPEHESYRIGHVQDFPSIYEAYASSSLVDWRRSLYTFGPKAKPCDSCNQACISRDESEVLRREEIAEKYEFASKTELLEVVA